ncbi:nucleotidyltransferase domain-containing protein [Sphingomonas psychrotolerans]|uniref:Nucleotidyltransferase family protein n=1 Tax=Sphingomonas psychrotolerans TaxID=1327635 RepID=A0A2K8MNI6_9SPHN|nr:nucleotidyltransferase family protein [Sphingomonas psychrotolerans]ATY34316.1 hypothetical protein CVN68_22075 [Sphingomonas psychrotolerans]
MSPELQLATACCRYPHGPAAHAAIAAALASRIDWTEFGSVVQRHRISGLAASALCNAAFDVPPETRKRLAQAAHQCATQDLLHAAETARLQQIFDDAGTPAMFLKGATIGILAYGRLGIKQSWDIDLLTTEACMAKALQVLERSGYRLVDPVGLPRDALPRFARFYHEAQVRDERGITVELHWRLFSKPILPGVTGDSETQVVRIGGREVRTLREDLLIAYMIAHGQEHGWSRLKWLADLNALLAQKSEDALMALHTQARAFDLGAKTSTALLLCARLFDLRLPDHLAVELRQDRIAERLVEVSLDCIAHPLTGSAMPALSRTKLALMASRFREGRGWPAVAAELGSLWTQPITRARYPAALDFAYHLLRLPILLLRLPLKLNEIRQIKPSAMPGRES